MMKISEMSKLTGVSIRTLQYYDKIGLLCPTKYTESGYRLYDDTALERLQQILLFRELEFPLKEIKRIINSPEFDRQKALEQQITLYPKITTEELASQSGKGIRTIKRHIAKMPYIRYVGSGYSGYWEVGKKESKHDTETDSSVKT